MRVGYDWCVGRVWETVQDWCVGWECKWGIVCVRWACERVVWERGVTRNAQAGGIQVEIQAAWERKNLLQMTLHERAQKNISDTENTPGKRPNKTWLSCMMCINYFHPKWMSYTPTISYPLAPWTQTQSKLKASVDGLWRTSVAEQVSGPRKIGKTYFIRYPFGWLPPTLLSCLLKGFLGFMGVRRFEWVLTRRLFGDLSGIMTWLLGDMCGFLWGYSIWFHCSS